MGQPRNLLVGSRLRKPAVGREDRCCWLRGPLLRAAWPAASTAASRGQLLSPEARIIFYFINLGAENFIIDQSSHISVCQILIEIHGNVLATVNGKAKVV